VNGVKSYETATEASLMRFCWGQESGEKMISEVYSSELGRAIKRKKERGDFFGKEGLV